MVTIKATCPICGDVDLTPAQVKVVTWTHRIDGEYSFACLECNTVVTKPAPPEVIKMLSVGGVTFVRIVVPAEAFEVHEGPRLTTDDLLDLLLDLENLPTLA